MKHTQTAYLGPQGQRMVQLATMGPRGWLINQGLARDIEQVRIAHAALVEFANSADYAKGVVQQPDAQLVRKVYIGFIENDSDPLNPRTEWDNLSVISCSKSVRYAISDKDADLPDDVRSEDELRKWVGEPLAAIKPLYLFDHSGITIRTSPFSCPWDSGQIGWVYITSKTANKEWSRNKKHPTRKGWAEQMIECEIESFDQFLRGECYRYEVREVTIHDDEQMEDIEALLKDGSYGGDAYASSTVPDWVEDQSEHMDSCSGYFGLEDCVKEMQSVLKHYRDKAAVPSEAESSEAV